MKLDVKTVIEAAIRRLLNNWQLAVTLDGAIVLLAIATELSDWVNLVGALWFLDCMIWNCEFTTVTYKQRKNMTLRVVITVVIIVVALLIHHTKELGLTLAVVDFLLRQYYGK